MILTEAEQKFRIGLLMKNVRDLKKKEDEERASAADKIVKLREMQARLNAWIEDEERILAEMVAKPKTPAKDAPKRAKKASAK